MLIQWLYRVGYVIYPNDAIAEDGVLIDRRQMLLFLKISFSAWLTDGLFTEKQLELAWILPRMGLGSLSL